ncbi:GntR family transcriptional regulator [Metabacillus halosaccharovorans]|uniref:GntR family transcriptional regulator n=1 Tax=Metabacillus halosaccharovorans TaxID=930124 RepID=UPI00203EDBE0|nr:GntR family transcriptional regulator [Metabacillus halosaccharovorans]MCM3443540.1 GntR family transcriptional regulator [Metabacillus halosaccharovorans]
MNQNIIKVASMNDQVYERLRHQISIGQISPGEKTTLRELADFFGVSTTPVREAVRRLQAENLLEVEKRSVSIRKLSKEEVKQTFSIRKRLESLATEWAVPNIERDHLKGLYAMLTEMDNPLISNSDWQELNRRFHLQIYKFANSQQLYQLIENVWNTVNPYMHLYTNEVSSFEESQTQHRKLLGFIEEKNMKDLLDLLDKHLEETYQTILVALEKEH